MIRKILAHAFSFALFLSATAMAGQHTPLSDPDLALQSLLEGNRQYVEGSTNAPEETGAARRAALATSQQPYAIILCCSDSRVAPEIIFNKGLGELFVVRVAGNVSDPVVMGSIEYAAEHLGAALVMVLGHERCGAVTAAVEANGKRSDSRNIDAVLKIITPAVARAKSICGAAKDSSCTPGSAMHVECAVDENARRVADGLRSRSIVLRHLANEKKISIVAARYDLDDGLVTLLD